MALAQIERNAKIIELWRLGWSNSKVARYLSSGGEDCTMNTVAGVLNRAGLSRGTAALNEDRAQLSKINARTQAPPKVIPAPKPIKAEVPEPERIGPVGDWVEKDCCQFIKGPVNTQFQMCGHPTGEMQKYCPWHLEHIPGLSIRKQKAA